VRLRSIHAEVHRHQQFPGRFYRGLFHRLLPLQQLQNSQTDITSKTVASAIRTAVAILLRRRGLGEPGNPQLSVCRPTRTV
jgi:hypothetical protein